MSQVKVILTVMKYVNKQLQIKPRIFLLIESHTGASEVFLLALFLTAY